MSIPWYNSSYLLRRGVKITSPDGAPAGHFVQYTLKDHRKSLQPGYTDILVVYSTADATPVNTVLDRTVTANTDGSLTIQWNLVNALQPNLPDPGYYYVYEACSTAAHVIAPPSSYTYSPWPIQEGNSGSNISYTRPGDYWLNGVTSKVGATARISFYGTAIQVESNTGPDFGTMEVQLDGQGPQIVDLYSVARQSNTVIFSAQSLDSTYHTIKIMATGQANPASNGVSVNISGFNLVKYLDVQDLGEEVYPIVWSSHVGG